MTSARAVWASIGISFLWAAGFSNLNSPPVSVQGQSGSGVAFTNAGLFSESYASFTDISEYQGITAATVEMWVNPKVLPPIGGRAGLFDVEGGFSLFLYAHKDMNAALTPNVIRCDAGLASWSTTSIPANQWTHVACTFSTVPGNPNHLRVETYINGVLEDAQEPAGNNMFQPAPVAVFIGANATNGADPFTGTMDGIRVFSTKRTPQQICDAASNCP